MRFRVDVEAQRVAGFAVGRARLIRGAVGHHDRDLVIVGVDALSIEPSSKAPGYRFGNVRGKCTIRSNWSELANRLGTGLRSVSGYNWLTCS